MESERPGGREENTGGGGLSWVNQAPFSSFHPAVVTVATTLVGASQAAYSARGLEAPTFFFNSFFYCVRAYCSCTLSVR